MREGEGTREDPGLGPYSKIQVVMLLGSCIYRSGEVWAGDKDYLSAIFSPFSAEEHEHDQTSGILSAPFIFRHLLLLDLSSLLLPLPYN